MFPSGMREFAGGRLFGTTSTPQEAKTLREESRLFVSEMAADGPNDFYHGLLDAPRWVVASAILTCVTISALGNSQPQLPNDSESSGGGQLEDASLVCE